MGPGFSHLWNQLLGGKAWCQGSGGSSQTVRGFGDRQQDVELCMGMYVYLGIRVSLFSPG